MISGQIPQSVVTHLQLALKMDSSSLSVPLSSIENIRRKRSRLPKHPHFASKDISRFSPCEVQNFLTQTKACKKEEKKENSNEHGIENNQMMMRSSNNTLSSSIYLKSTSISNTSTMEPSEFPNFSDLSPIKKPYCIAKDHQDLDDQRDDSFRTQETVPETDSETDDMDIVTKASSSMYSKQSLSVHFADEVGLPIESIRHYECDRRQREHSELVVLCICPEKKTFEFLHVGYHRYQENDTSLADLLRGLPDMCTNPVFAKAKFVSLYRNNGVDRVFENLCAPRAKQTDPAVNETTIDSNSDDCDNEMCRLPLQDFAFRENEVVVAAIDGSSERAVLLGIGPLLRNEKILKTLKRARRSRRGLKFVRGEADGDKGSSNHLQKSRDLSVRRRRTKKESKVPDENHPKPNAVPNDAVPNLDSDCGGLVDEYCHDYDPLYDVAQYHRQLLLGIIAISSGTAIFAALGL